MDSSLQNLAWPAARLSEAIQAVALASGLTHTSCEVSELATNLEDAGECIENAAGQLGLEAQVVEAPYAGFAQQLLSMSPAVLRLPNGFLGLVRCGRSGIRTLAPDGTMHSVPAELIRAAMCHELEAPLIQQVEEMLGRAEVAKARRRKAREAILRERLGAIPVRGIWLLRLPPSSDFLAQLRRARVPQKIAALGALHSIQYALWLAAWWLIGAAALNGRFERGWLIAWALLLLTLVPLRVTITWLQGATAIASGAILKQRLFFGALHMDPDSIRHQGVGQLLGRVIESEAVESMALSGGFLGLVAVIELAFAAFVLGLGAGGAMHVMALLAWAAITGVIAREYLRRYRNWTDTRLTMTHDLVESMVGHRTRLAQQRPEDWHAEEDQALDAYLRQSSAVDRCSALLLAGVPRGWIVLGLAALIPAFHSGGSAPRVAVAIGGILVAWRAFKRLSAGLSQVLGATVAWRQVAPLSRAAAQSRNESVMAPARGKDQPVIEAHDLTFRYLRDGEAVLRDCSFRIARNERVLLEGPSGGGKSTLVSVITGMRRAESGSLAIGGMDAHKVGVRAWRRSVAAAPQFQENHVLAETLAFNLLMARDRMPSRKDLIEAEEVARELGLGELLGRMPSGMLQMVGETGWQLSHGERSRVYIARALLQNADLVVLDESFAALDPENLMLVMQCVLKRAPTLLVIAHR
jgi:ABC-type multidrug transport system fused ATPase/permease subunit